MNAVATPVPATFRTSRIKVAVLLTSSVAFVATGVWMASEKPLIGYLCIVFFGLCALVFTVQLHPNSSYLTVSPDGFTFCALFRQTFVPWSQTTEFVVVNVRNHQMVGWNYALGYQGQKAGRVLAKAIAGVEAALPDTYGIKASDLANLMNDARRRYVPSTRP